VDVEREPANNPDGSLLTDTAFTDVGSPKSYASARSLIDERERLWRATHGLRKIAPHLSAHDGLTRRQRRVIIAVLVVVLLAFVLDRRHTGIAIVAFMTVVYTSVIALRLLLIVKSLGRDEDDTDAGAFVIPDHELPLVTVLLPMYKEPEVIGSLINALGALDYPANKLEIMLVLEGDDDETIVAAREAIASSTSHIRSSLKVIEVPPAEPRTKPKAMNYAIQLARGSVITIYDAEDIPDPLQLRKAVVALARGGDDLACVQGQLNYFNPEQNTLTRWFTLEYTMWFQQFLPGLVRLGAPVPLGGTSNHFRREALMAVGGWDPFNVTEDADLGLRFHRMGYRVGVIDSVTLEEANSDVINWVKQRSRWYKGYLQTWLVNIRHPVRTAKTLGPTGYTVLNLFVGGTPLLAMLNPIYWFLTILWFGLQPQFIREIFPAGLYYPGMACWIIGNFLYLYAFILTALKREDVNLVKAACAIPLYYVLMALAAYKAFVQLVFTPTYWEKTQHGLGAASSGRNADDIELRSDQPDMMQLHVGAS
jgi:cellulose synthase/poly-beta-1,6-N-acetylglucosamine synthase-like glycosyltransferase